MGVDDTLGSPCCYYHPALNQPHHAVYLWLCACATATARLLYPDVVSFTQRMVECIRSMGPTQDVDMDVAAQRLTGSSQ